MTQHAISPCSNPNLTMEQAFEAYSKIGFTKFEAFVVWVKSALDLKHDPQEYRDYAAKFGLEFCSMHLPVIGEDLDESLEQAIAGARFAEKLGAKVVLYKACNRPTYIAGAKRFLDATEDLDIIPVLQNHCHSPICTIADFREVIEGINDPRMHTLLEVGHFHMADVRWDEGYDLLGSSVSLVHLKDMIGEKPVPFGEGEVDFHGLFRQLKADGYTGDFVIEVEIDHSDDERTLGWLVGAKEHLSNIMKEVGYV